MEAARHRFEPLNTGHELTAFDCGDEHYDRWLRDSAHAAVRSGTAAVTVLVNDAHADVRVVGYFALCPTGVVRGGVPRRAGAGALDPIPAYLLAKMALHRDYRGDPDARWGTQLLLGALRRVLAASTVGGGRLLIVDAGHERLVPWYTAHGFLPTGGDPLRLYMKVATIRTHVADYDADL